MKWIVRTLFSTGFALTVTHDVSAQHAHFNGVAPPVHSGGGGSFAQSAAAAPILGYAGAGWAGSGFTNSYIPTYLLGSTGPGPRSSVSSFGGGGYGTAFPFGGFGPAAIGSSPMQIGPGGLWLTDLFPAGAPQSSLATPPVSRSDRPNRAGDLVEIGNRSFRGGNFRRAEERYHTAARSDAEAPDPHVRLAQVAMVRGDYNKAATSLREAVAAARSPGWLLQTPDIQSMFGEPKDFAKQIARLETHLQAHPQDRNAWFVLGAENFLTGRHQQAQDAFLRLADQPADAALTAFQDAAIIARRTDGAEPTRTVSQ